MKIILAKSAGFCFGVKRATQMAFDAADQMPRICSLGPIIHSPQMVRKLEEKGVRVVKSVDDLEDGAVIIRSHGVTVDELEGILAAATWRSSMLPAPLSKKPRTMRHSSVAKGTWWCWSARRTTRRCRGSFPMPAKGRSQWSLISGEAEALPRTPRMGIVAQTTQSLENLREVVDFCLQRSKELRVFNTICDATAVRQNEARKIAAEVDLMLVIGGYNSANTNRLAQLCCDLQSNTYHVETAAEVDSAWFAEVKTVGITAGASTPRWIIDEVVERVESIAAGKAELRGGQPGLPVEK